MPNKQQQYEKISQMDRHQLAGIDRTAYHPALSVQGQINKTGKRRSKQEPERESGFWGIRSFYFFFFP